jgi:glycerol kinase
MPFFLAVDQSTSATKALLFDEQAGILDRESKPHAQQYPQPGWCEQDAWEIWQNTLTVLRTLLARHHDKWQDLVCLSICNQRETTVVFDRDSGRPLHPAIVWQCRRSADICQRHQKAGPEKLVTDKTGLRVDPYFSASKLQWLIEANEDLAGRLAGGSALASTIDAYLVHRLTNGRVFATDVTNASRTLLFNLDSLEWDPELCALFGIPMACLPEIRDCDASFGETDIEGLLPRPLPVIGVMGDSQASLFAQRCFEKGTAKVTLGTGSSILLNVGPTRQAGNQGVVEALAWVACGKPAFAHEGIIISAASTLEWLKNQLAVIDDVHQSEALARELDDNGNVYLVPAFTGLGLPHWQPDARAAIVGLSPHSDRRHLVRAALEAIAYQLRDALEAMRSGAEVEIRRLHVDGGPSANRFLTQFIADINTVELRINTAADCSPTGACMAGMLGSGSRSSLQDLSKLPRDDITCSPKIATEAAGVLYSGWQRAVRQVLAGIS